MKIGVDRLKQEHSLPPEGYKALLTCRDPDVLSYLYARPVKWRWKISETTSTSGG